MEDLAPTEKLLAKEDHQTGPLLQAHSMGSEQARQMIEKPDQMPGQGQSHEGGSRTDRSRWTRPLGGGRELRVRIEVRTFPGHRLDRVNAPYPP